MNKLSIIYFIDDDDEAEWIVVFSNNKLILFGEDDSESDMDSYICGCYAFCNEHEKFEVTDKLEAPLFNGVDFDRVLIHELLSRLQSTQSKV